MGMPSFHRPCEGCEEGKSSLGVPVTRGSKLRPRPSWHREQDAAFLSPFPFSLAGFVYALHGGWVRFGTGCLSATGDATQLCAHLILFFPYGPLKASRRVCREVALVIKELSPSVLGKQVMSHCLVNPFPSRTVERTCPFPNTWKVQLLFSVLSAVWLAQCIQFVGDVL